MSDSSRLFFTGNTLEQAVLTAATHYDIDPDELAYDRVERRTGFLRGRRRIVIRVDSAKPRRKLPNSGNSLQSLEKEEGPRVPETQADFNLHKLPLQHPADPPPATPARGEGPRPQQQRRVRQNRHARSEHAGHASARQERHPRPDPDHPAHHTPREPSEHPQQLEPEEWEPPELPEATGPTVDAVVRGVELLSQLADLEFSPHVFEGEDQLVVELTGSDQRHLVRSEGRLLLAVQHLLPRLVQGLTGEMAPCRVDSHGFRDKRVANLENLARRAADDVRQEHKPKTLSSMSPADRRTIHMALKEDGDVVTESEGHGFFKRITVRPA